MDFEYPESEREQRNSRVTLYTAGHLHTAVPYCSHSRAPIVHTAVPRENNEHGCVYLRCRAVCKLPGCVEGHPWNSGLSRSAHTPIKRISEHRDTISCHSLCCTNDLIDMKGRCCPKIVLSIPRSLFTSGQLRHIGGIVPKTALPL